MNAAYTSYELESKFTNRVQRSSETDCDYVNEIGRPPEAAAWRDALEPQRRLVVMTISLSAVKAGCVRATALCNRRHPASSFEGGLLDATRARHIRERFPVVRRAKAMPPDHANVIVAYGTARPAILTNVLDCYWSKTQSGPFPAFVSLMDTVREPAGYLSLIERNLKYTYNDIKV
ncbi:hypothetical protein EVAR_52949_1 [Eumeta japonica]|uniref:Uncharacterized protein n=1 Tax=Eumeta variegata TaxID=151549 RepID=A0A4C1XRN3_EUMVA|nr:hypothetical protein EVAR_52949_1 [Eumeta japonica]